MFLPVLFYGCGGVGGGFGSGFWGGQGVVWRPAVVRVPFLELKRVYRPVTGVAIVFFVICWDYSGFLGLVCGRQGAGGLVCVWWGFPRVEEHEFSAVGGGFLVSRGRGVHVIAVCPLGVLACVCGVMAVSCVCAVVADDACERVWCGEFVPEGGNDETVRGEGDWYGVFHSCSQSVCFPGEAYEEVWGECRYFGQ